MRLIKIAGTLLMALAPVVGIGLSAGPASASSWVQYNTAPDHAATILGPGCTATPDLNYGASGSWSTAGGDYSGTGQYQDSYDGRHCGGSTDYIVDQSTQTAQFRWHIRGFCASSGCISVYNYCKIWIYIPTQYAGDFHARYDFWGDDGNGHLAWLAWPGGTVDQEDNSGWTFIGEVTANFNEPILTISLSNADPTTPGWYAGAGDLAYMCYQ